MDAKDEINKQLEAMNERFNRGRARWADKLRHRSAVALSQGDRQAAINLTYRIVRAGQGTPEEMKFVEHLIVANEQKRQLEASARAVERERRESEVATRRHAHANAKHLTIDSNPTHTVFFLDTFDEIRCAGWESAIKVIRARFTDAVLCYESMVEMGCKANGVMGDAEIHTHAFFGPGYEHLFFESALKDGEPIGWVGVGPDDWAPPPAKWCS